MLWLVGLVSYCFLSDSYDSVNPVWRNILKQKHWLGNSYVEKSIILGFWDIHWTSCTYFKNCVLGDVGWDGCFAGQLVGQKLRRKHHGQKSFGFLNIFDILPHYNFSRCWHLSEHGWSKNKGTKTETNTNKHATKQINKRTNKETNKTNNQSNK